MLFTQAPARLYRVGKYNSNLVLPHDKIVRQRGEKKEDLFIMYLRAVDSFKFEQRGKLPINWDKWF